MGVCAFLYPNYINAYILWHCSGYYKFDLFYFITPGEMRIAKIIWRLNPFPIENLTDIMSN